ncbi:MAG: hypothetical protein ACYDAJ_04880 [Nitrosotalea sp.]
MNFKYVTESFVDKVGNTVHFVPRPKIEIVFRKYPDAKNPDTNPEFRIFGLVDSGADISYIPRQIAEILKLDLEESSKKESKSASESFWTFRTKVHLEIVYGTRRIPVGMIDISVPEKYDLGEDIEKKVLLGRNGLFSNYEITFNEDAKAFTLKRHYEQDSKRSHLTRRH